MTGALIDLEEHLNALDAKVGDGDTGSTFAAGAREIAERLERQQLPLNDLPTLFALIGERLTVVMGRLQRGIDVYLLHRCRAEAGARRQRGRGAERRSGTDEVLRRADEGDRTMIDALQPALAALLAEPENLQAAFAAGAGRADRTCQSSKAGAGRASYLNSESLLGNMDPGRHAVAMVFKALADAKPSPVALATRGDVAPPKSRSGKA
ncbi:DAK2 domain-containing protein [Klebsiella pneumoniae]